MNTKCTLIKLCSRNVYDARNNVPLNCAFIDDNMTGKDCLTKLYFNMRI